MLTIHLQRNAAAASLFAPAFMHAGVLSVATWFHVVVAPMVVPVQCLLPAMGLAIMGYRLALCVGCMLSVAAVILLLLWLLTRPAFVRLMLPASLGAGGSMPGTLESCSNGSRGPSNAGTAAGIVTIDSRLRSLLSTERDGAGGHFPDK